jgi:alkylated DNA nucleotide flippase Atl1
MLNSISTTSNLFFKPTSGLPAISLNQLKLLAGLGIMDDIHAHAASPRQVLVVRQEDLHDLLIEPGQLSENIVVAGVDINQFVPGAVLQFTGGAAVRLTFYCEPCKRIAHLVRSIKDIQKKRGILGVIVSDGLLSVTEELTIQPGAFEALSEIPYQRFLDFLLKIPVGKVATYQTVILGIGVDRGYFRAIPGYLQKAAAAGHPAHRVLDSKGYLTPHLENQRDRLVAEGVEVIDDSERSLVSIEKYLWLGSYF